MTIVHWLNVSFREVLLTGARSQLVVMHIPPGGEIGTETHGRIHETKADADADVADEGFGQAVR